MRKNRGVGWWEEKDGRRRRRMGGGLEEEEKDVRRRIGDCGERIVEGPCAAAGGAGGSATRHLSSVICYNILNLFSVHSTVKMLCFSAH